MMDWNATVVANADAAMLTTSLKSRFSRRLVMLWHVALLAAQDVDLRVDRHAAAG